jgi:glycolate oxidase iron-sulfur subunit
LSAPTTTASAPAVSSSSANGGGSLKLDPRTYQRGLSCVHCGLCLPACPTYTQSGHEGDSPRGRIQLMLGLAEGQIEPTDSVRKHLDLCLDCRGCETACPSGVVYHELIEETRARMYQPPTTLQDRFMRWMFFNVFVYPNRLKLALLPARVMQKLGVYALLRKTGLFNVLPSQLRKMEQMLPAKGKLWPRPLPARVAPRSTGVSPVSSSSGSAEHGRDARATKRVGFFAGCIGSVMFEKVNRQAVELLAAAGAEVITPHAQGCCGAIHHHNGAHHPAEELAKRNIDTFLPVGGAEVDFIATNIAGCGAMLREYDFLLRDDPHYKDRAKVFASKVRDISEVLAEVGLPELKHAVNETVTYHDACHLAHAQKVVNQPRALLAKIPGLKLVPLPESDICCGAAGTYNLTQPKMATDLAERKLRNIATTNAPVCATGNVGCAMQIQSEADARGQQLHVVHPVELLHRAAFGI